MVPKAKIMDEVAIRRAVARISHEIMERNQGLENVCIFGVKRRGVPLAQMLCENIKKYWNVDVPCGNLDVTCHRDDLTDEDKQANAGQSDFPCDIRNKIVIVVDDVVYTGRTARAAMETVFSYGRPQMVQFVALVDRGHRELPIRPDYVGKNVPTAQNEIIRVQLEGIDSETGVYICDCDKE
jgi:pyrimidine operon attenuation protein/uracil phosphoribosyltransferase